MFFFIEAWRTLWSTPGRHSLQWASRVQLTDQFHQSHLSVSSDGFQWRQCLTKKYNKRTLVWSPINASDCIICNIGCSEIGGLDLKKSFGRLLTGSNSASSSSTLSSSSGNHSSTSASAATVNKAGSLENIATGKIIKPFRSRSKPKFTVRPFIMTLLRSLAIRITQVAYSKQFPSKFCFNFV